jgi:acyl CoA:acetate/3-ketoacid CoA transferase alpha subunit
MPGAVRYVQTQVKSRRLVSLASFELPAAAADRGVAFESQTSEEPKMGKGTFEYRGATVLAAGMMKDSGRYRVALADRAGNVTVADYRPQVEPAVVAASKADIARQIGNLRKRRARAVLREAVAA